MSNKDEAMFANQRYLELDDEGLFIGTEVRKQAVVFVVPDELDMMEADLQQMRAGTWLPMVGLASALCDEPIDSEWIGHEVSTQWGLP